MSRTRVRRRRIAVTVVSAALAVGLSAPLARAIAGPPPQPAAHRTYVVRSGDTLWSIAGRLAPGADPRPVVAQIQRANHVDAGSLTPGQTLVVPAA